VADRTRSHLMKAQELEAQICADLLPSLQITQAQDAAEHAAFRAILFGMSIRRIGDHRLDQIARANQDHLKDVWPRLEPLLDDYEWLWERRNEARYNHIDIGSFSDPPITPDMLMRAKSIVRGLIQIAESLV